MRIKSGILSLVLFLVIASVPFPGLATFAADEEEMADPATEQAEPTIEPEEMTNEIPPVPAGGGGIPAQQEPLDSAQAEPVPPDEPVEETVEAQKQLNQPEGQGPINVEVSGEETEAFGKIVREDPELPEEETAEAPPPPRLPLEDIPEDGEIRLNFRGASLDTVLDYLSKAAGFIVVRDVDVDARVDVWSHQPLTEEEAVNLLNTILNDKGYTAIRNGRILRIVDRDTARTRELPVYSGRVAEEVPRTDEMVTHIIPVMHADAEELIEDLKPLVPEYAIMTANAASNTIILTDTRNSIRRIVEIIQALDTSVTNILDVKVVQLEYADAEQLADVIGDVFEAPSPSGSSGSSSRGGRGGRMADFISRMRGRGR